MIRPGDVADGLLVTGFRRSNARSRTARLDVSRQRSAAREVVGYQGVLAVHAEGSLEAEKLVLCGSCDLTRAVGLARRLAELGSG